MSSPLFHNVENSKKSRKTLSTGTVSIHTPELLESPLAEITAVSLSG
jgi:hypothetical protein